MDDLLSLNRAARLVGVSRSDLQKKIQNGEMNSFDGKVAVADLMLNYPSAQLEDTREFARIAQIKERAFGKRVFERALPDAEVLAARITELSKTLAQSQSQLKQFNLLLSKLWDKLGELEGQCHGESKTKMESLKCWIKQEVASAMEPGFSNPLAIKDGILSVMTAQVTLLPSQQDFLVEGQDTLLEAAMRAGISLNYGCSGGNCGLCKGRVLSGQVKKIRHHDFPLSEAEKEQGTVLMCSNTAVSDITLEAAITGSVQEIPYQQITASVKTKALLSDEVMLVHLQTPRSQRLRFLAGQRVSLRVAQSFDTELSIASCPCDDRNLLFHVRRQPGNLFSDHVFEKMKSGEAVEVTGPQGEFILHEKSDRPLYFFAFDGGFAPIKSLVEHAMSLAVSNINLCWIASDKGQLYLPNVGRAWGDALDNFHYAEQTMDFDLRVMNTKREASLLQFFKGKVAQHPEWMQGDIYLAGPESAVVVAEQFFASLGLPKSRVFVEAVK
ncbi:MAG: 2Fe-2S iron-sulfur cluster-binding protein [Sideroxydans sp.]|nr:2Fe-2S iron-sulfur cluster-binding protein [Sideroxydans sp.]